MDGGDSGARTGKRRRGLRGFRLVVRFSGGIRVGAWVWVVLAGWGVFSGFFVFGFGLRASLFEVLQEFFWVGFDGMDEHLNRCVDIGVEVDTNLEYSDFAYRVWYLDVSAVYLAVHELGQCVCDDSVGDGAVQASAGAGAHGDVYPLVAEFVCKALHVVHGLDSLVVGLLLQSVDSLESVARGGHSELVGYEVVPREPSLDFLDFASSGNSLDIL